MKRIYTISRLVLLCLLFSTVAFAQNVAVKGKVTDATTGEFLPGVTVAVQGTTTGTQTDVNGAFTINVPSSATITFSFVGYTAQQIAVNARTTLDVKLANKASELQQVVVVGYGTQRKIDVTGSVSQVRGEELSKQPDPNPVSALQGKVAGVQITNSGTPGASPQITIRGQGTVYGNNNPLYVVDGVWFDDISFLNSNDIESMSILKDASSEAIYGVRAANGVVLITTKKGKGGKPTVNYNGYVGVQKVTNMVKMANASQYAELVNELNGTTSFADPASLGKGTDWFDVILRKAFTTNHNVSLSGSTDKSSYNMSIGYFNQQGNVKTNSYDRVTVRLQQDLQAYKFLKVGYNAILQGSNSKDVPADIIYKAYTAAPVVPVYNADGTYGDPANYPIGNSPTNPQAQLDNYNQRTKDFRFNGNMFGELKFNDHLTFRTSFGADVRQNEVRNYIPAYAATTNQFNTTSDLTLTKTQSRNWIWENTLTYNQTFNKDHRLTVLLGQSAQHYYNYYSIATVQNAPNSTATYYINSGDASTTTVRDYATITTSASYFGRVNYAYKDKYLLNASIRRDGSSAFSSDQRWGAFPSIGAGWVISNEDFFKDQNIFNNLKIRGSWGKIGNSAIPANIYTNTVSRTGDLTAVYGTTNGVIASGANITTISNPILYWERGVGTDLGLEGSLFNNRFTFEIDYYNRVTQKGIFDVPVLKSLGTTNGSIITNQADFRNRGWEFSAGWKGNTGKDFSYAINGNFSINNNKVTANYSGNNIIYVGSGATGGNTTSITTVGLPISVFYGYRVTGIFQNAAQIASSSQKSASPGDFIYQDVNSDGVIDGKDRVVLGNPNPKYQFGLNTTFNYKNFDLTVDIQGVAKVDVYNANKGLRYGAENYTLDFYKNRWHGEGTSNTYPSANIGGGSNYYPNSWYVESGSYVRLRNLQLGYNLPSSVTSKLHIQRLRIYANAQNAVNIFGYTGFNPEIGRTASAVSSSGVTSTAAGIDNGVYPLYATYNLGLNVTF
ncbi:TonB-dependent receptor [Mucilaginibacter robiniae]|uniref:TonB-dependent receptor n=1 Tax=Mucilaginibacter robiniae TaxID=2728022 RepID=A0A7L5EA17_9SPHI|nr:TonB-dependent receptor [Mucilaginibacter robiniae]QJD97743.1 TonB-dependent receptor [Mucilaginibacter robiniae]